MACIDENIVCFCFVLQRIRWRFEELSVFGHFVLRVVAYVPRKMGDNITVW